MYRRIGVKPGPWITEPEIVRSGEENESEIRANKRAVEIG